MRKYGSKPERHPFGGAVFALNESSIKLNESVMFDREHDCYIVTVLVLNSCEMIKIAEGVEV
jgi:hypothetical protein